MDWQREEWKDAGWAKMNVILDREMPQKKKRHRFFLMWFGLAGIALIAVGIIWSRSGKLNSVETPIPLVSKSQPTKDPNTNEEITEIIENSASQEPISSNTESTYAEPSRIGKKIVPSEVKNNENYNKNANQLSESVAQHKPDKVKKDVVLSNQRNVNESFKNEKSKEPTQSIIEDNLIHKDLASNPEKEILDTRPARIISTLARLPVLVLDLDDFERAITWVEMKDWETPIKVQTKTTFTPKLTGELFGGAYPGLKTYSFGWNAGMAVGYHFAPRWALKLGAGWGRHQFENLNFYGVSDAIVASDPLEDINSEFVVTPVYDPQVAQKKSLAYIDIPFQVSFYLSDHWYTYAGYQQSFLLSINDPFSLKAEENLDSRQDESTVDLDPYAQELLVRKNSALLGGIGYQLGRFSFQAGYQHGLTNLISSKINTESSIYRRNLSIQLFFKI